MDTAHVMKTKRAKGRDGIYTNVIAMSSIEHGAGQPGESLVAAAEGLTDGKGTTALAEWGADSAEKDPWIPGSLDPWGVLRAAWTATGDSRSGSSIGH